jgi:hypothetical protein
MSVAENLRQLSEERTRQILRERKKRDQTSCYPCRSRKVKCNRQLPCDTCVKRGYPDLCLYNAPRGGSRSQPVSHSHLLEQLTPSQDSPRLSESSSESNRAANQGNPFLGINSIPSFLRQRGTNDQSTVEEAVLPMLGLGASTSYPFLPAPQISIDRFHAEFHSFLPTNREVTR